MKEIGIKIPEIILPKKGTDMTAWASVACDQFTSQPDYWEDVEKITDGLISTAHLMLPEIFLESNDVDSRIKKINDTMNEYLENKDIEAIAPGMMLVKRDTKLSPVRTGLIMSLDLEQYDYSVGSTSLIRATEGTVLERIPPRMKIRKNASIELPHIMILIDDPQQTVIEPVSEALCGKIQPEYDFELMKNGGHITGYSLSDEKIINNVVNSLKKLANKDDYAVKYNLPKGSPVLLFAVGDGNHSLASAKCHWEYVKAEITKNGGNAMNHPARFALVEVVNIHDKGIVFEPIHRVLFGVNKDEFIDGLINYYEDKVSCTFGDSEPYQSEFCHAVPFYTGTGNGVIYFDKEIHNLAVGALAQYIDEFLKNHTEVKVDYIHGDEITKELGTKAGNMGFILPVMRKEDFFQTVIEKGSLPRKTFSMGEANEKRYYVECRKII